MAMTAAEALKMAKDNESGITNLAGAQHPEKHG